MRGEATIATTLNLATLHPMAIKAIEYFVSLSDDVPLAFPITDDCRLNYDHPEIL